MLFNSVEFLIYFSVVTTLYFLLPHKYRCHMLLIASCVFYMAFIPVYILILFVTITIDYFAGILIEDTINKTKKWYLVGSIISTCLVLFIFKYLNFFNTNLSALAEFLRWNYPIESLNLILPIGLSFHTFQSLSYVIEVYKGNQKAERNYIIYSLYVMFYPQLVAGPIERPQNLLHQFYEKHDFEYTRVTTGLKLMAWGMFKKVVIADRLAIAVDQVYGNPTEYNGIALIIATIFFAFQIYCDFSGYSDIAIGAAQVMGFKLMDNFNRPYLSKSISEFWKRWHISLSTWFKDYLYIPLGGNRVPKWRWQFNLLITFVISGLWHGANWTFIVWGALNGFYLVAAIWTADFRTKVKEKIGLSKNKILDNCWKVFATFSLICFAWIFFRASSISDAWYIATHLFSGISNWLSYDYIYDSLKNIGLDRGQFLIATASIGFLVFVQLIQEQNTIRKILLKRSIIVRWSIYYAMLIAILLLGVFGNKEFIYFQF